MEKNFDILPVCVHPWAQINLGWDNFSVCCNSATYDFGQMNSFTSNGLSLQKDIFNHTNFVKKRQFLGEGMIPDACIICAKYTAGISRLPNVCAIDLDILARIEDIGQRTRAAENLINMMNSFGKKETVVSHYPTNAVVTVGSLCNLKCKFCYNHGMGYQADPVEILSIIEQIHETLINVSLTGGEPILNKAGREIFKTFGEGKYKFAVKFGTNAQQFDYDLYSQVNLADVQISTDAATKKVYEIIRVGGCFDALISNIKKFMGLKDEKPFLKISTNYTITSDNYMDIPEACKLYEDLGAFVMFHLVIRGKRDPQNIQERPDLYEPLLIKLDEALGITNSPATKSMLESIKQTILGKMQGSKEVL